MSGNVKYNSIFYFYFFKLLEKFQVLMYCAITMTSLTVLGRSLPAVDVVTGKIFINSCHPVINAWQGLWNELSGSSGMITKGRDPALLWKSPQLVSIWILCTVILRLTALINMHLQRTVMKDHCVFIELFISAVKLFWHRRFSSDIGREIQYVIPMVKINSFVVYSSSISEVKVWVI